VSDVEFQTLWYITLPALFNVGWAMVQISHMSIVNSLTHSNRKRDKMVNQRNGFTYAANITVLLAALIVFLIVDNGITQFRILLALVLLLGTCTSSFFIFTIREPKLSAMATKLEREYKV
jgi:Na+/melibiose symporter-like transporter